MVLKPAPANHFKIYLIRVKIYLIMDRDPSLSYILSMRLLHWLRKDSG